MLLNSQNNHVNNKLRDSQLVISICEEMMPQWIKKIITKIIHPLSNNFESLAGDNEHIKPNLINL
jgi:hypothetical protein